MKQWKIRLIALITAISITTILSGCALLVIGGVGAAGGYYYRKGLDKKGKKPTPDEQKSNPTSTDTTNPNNYSTETTSN